MPFQDFKEVCSIDKLFSDVMDGLIVVDLLQTERKTLERYMGSEGLFTFLAHHHAAHREENPENIKSTA